MALRQIGAGKLRIVGGGKVAMIRKTVKRLKLSDSSIKSDLAYWLSCRPEERILAVEALRREYYGDTARLQRHARVVKLSQG